MAQSTVRQNINKARSWWDDRSTTEKVVIGAGVAYAAYKLFIEDDRGHGDQSGGTSAEPGALTVNWKNVTRTKNQLHLDADEIESAIYGSGAVVSPTEDDDEIGEVLMRMNTDDDVYALIQIYGHRGYGVVATSKPNLVQAIQSYLDEDVKQEVNDNYAQKNMTAQWL